MIKAPNVMAMYAGAMKGMQVTCNTYMAPIKHLPIVIERPENTHDEY